MFSGNEKKIDQIWLWYDDQKEALQDYRNKVVEELYSEVSLKHAKFLNYTVEEINEYFDNSKLHLEELVTFELISSTEASLKMDYLRRSYNKDKSSIGRKFRDIYKLKTERVSLEKDIIETWKAQLLYKNPFHDFLGLLNFRNWIAHGRYWNPRLGRQYTPEIAYSIAEDISEIIQEQ
jgi:hypothetical protein